jgi:hypothetical protein
MKLTLASFAIAFLFFGNTAQAADSGCTLVTEAEVARAFDRVGGRNGSADGSCVWKVGDDGLAVQTIRRASAAEALEMYDGLEREVVGPLKRAASKPKIGQKAAAGMSVAGSVHPHATAIVLDGEWVTLVSYMAKNEAALTPVLLDKVVSLVRLAHARAADADQSFGACEWFGKDDAAAVLGTKGLTIHRHGPSLCIASSARQGASLMVSVPEALDADSVENTRRNDEKICTATPLPELGAAAYAAHACTLPGKPPLPAMQGHVQKNGRYAQITYVPGDRPAVANDLRLLMPIMRSTLEKL